jgi:hypothetical protein
MVGVLNSNDEIIAHSNCSLTLYLLFLSFFLSFFFVLEQGGDGGRAEQQQARRVLRAADLFRLERGGSEHGRVVLYRHHLHHLVSAQERRYFLQILVVSCPFPPQALKHS